MAVDLTAYDAMMKEYFIQQRVDNICNKDQPLLGWMPKAESFYGRNLPIPLQYGLPVGTGAGFTSAQANANGGKYVEFILTRVRDYGLLQLDNETMEASESDSGAWAKARIRETEGLIEILSERLAKNLVSNKGNAKARGASVSSAALTLANPDDVVHFAVGQRIQSDSGDGTSGAVNAGFVTLVGVDRDNGILHADANWASSITGFAATDYLFHYGDFGLGISGLDSWLPATIASSGDNHFGVDRYVDPTRLGGIRFDGTNRDVLTALELALARCRRDGAMIDTFWMNHQRFTECSLELGSQYQRTEVKYAGIGYDSIQFNSGGRKVNIMADINIPYTVCYGLTRKTWKFHTLKKAPRFLWTGNGNSIALPTADGIEMRMGWYGNLACDAPGRNVRVALAA